MARGRPKSPSPSELTKEIEIQFKHLRALVRDAFRNCAEKVEAQIEQAANDLLRPSPEALDALGLRRRASLLKDARRLMAALRVKPERGRYRDIKRLHNIAEDLAELASHMQ